MRAKKPIRHRIDIYKDHKCVTSAYFRSRLKSFLFHTLLNDSVDMADGELLGSYNPVYIETSDTRQSLSGEELLDVGETEKTQCTCHVVVWVDSERNLREMGPLFANEERAIEFLQLDAKMRGHIDTDFLGQLYRREDAKDIDNLPITDMVAKQYRRHGKHRHPDQAISVIR